MEGLAVSEEPIYEGDNLTISLNEDEYLKSLDANKYNVIGRLILQKGDTPPTAKELKEKLEKIWGLENMKFIPMGKGYFNVVTTMTQHSKVMSMGAFPSNQGYSESRGGLEIFIRLHKDKPTPRFGSEFGNSLQNIGVHQIYLASQRQRVCR